MDFTQDPEPFFGDGVLQRPQRFAQPAPDMELADL
jgi:hypothetical protein